ncbi:MAG TPA: galactokinase [Bryobacteraceae bacterium]|nr:galactokinase [Bryobacteraceae bacterium]
MISDESSWLARRPATRVFRAPGRVNLIGEHTDYNGGFVMPAAIDLATYVAVEARDDRELLVSSENFDQPRQFPLNDPDARAEGAWSDYVRGVAVTLERAGFHLRGATLSIRSDVPVGSGLSSSAALEVACAQALLAVSGTSLPGPELARLCQRAENEFVGVQCGIMDQFASCCGRADHAMLLDCRSFAWRMIPLPARVRLVICDTKVRRQLQSGDYNHRRAECEQGVRMLQSVDPSIRSLRDASLAILERARLPEIIHRRCRHVIKENSRTLRAAEALESDDLALFGRLMSESHESLRDDYQVSCPELDLMVRIAQALPGVYGSRMTGAGFGGCTLALLDQERAAEFARKITDEYQRTTAINLDVWTCRTAGGASEILPVPAP